MIVRERVIAAYRRQLCCEDCDGRLKQQEASLACCQNPCCKATFGCSQSCCVPLPKQRRPARIPPIFGNMRPLLALGRLVAFPSWAALMAVVARAVGAASNSQVRAASRCAAAIADYLQRLSGLRLGLVLQHPIVREEDGWAWLEDVRWRAEMASVQDSLPVRRQLGVCGTSRQEEDIVTRRGAPRVWKTRWRVCGCWAAAAAATWDSPWER